MKQLTDSPSRQSRIEFAGFRLDPKKRQLSRLDGTLVTLHSRAFDTLLVLAKRQGQLVTKQELLDTVWPGVVVEENNLNQAISALRKAFGDGVDRDGIIKTITGRGYCFVADTRIIEEMELEPATEVLDLSASVDTPARDWRRVAMVLAAGVIVLLLVLLFDRPATVRMPPITPPQSALPVVLPEQDNAVLGNPLPNSIAVLPLSTVDLDPAYAYFEQGLHDEILTQLGRISNLNVISRNTMLQYRNTTMTPAEIARELNVGTILEGSVRAAGTALRISLQMTDPRTNVSLWSATYNADVDQVEQIFAVQTDIAANVARTLRAELLPGELELVSMVPTNSPEAYKLYLEAYAALVPADYPKALHLLEQAVDVDPSFTAAWAELSMLNTLMTGVPEQTPERHHQQALEAAERALELDDEFAMAHVAMASVKNNAGDWETAAQEYARARELAAPLDGWPMYSLYQLSLADFAGAKQTLQHNLGIDPINLISRGFLMLVHEYLGDRSSSRAEYAKGEAMYPNWWGDNTGVWLALGRKDTAYLDKSLNEFPTYAMREVLEVYDQPATAVERLREIYRNNESYKPGPLLNAAMFAAYYEENALALDLIKTGLRDNWVSFYLLWLPVFDKIRRTEEFRQFLTESGIVAYWRRHGWPAVCQPRGNTDFECNWQAIPEN